MSKARPILLLEVNEVHWRALDRALERAPLPSLRSFVARARTHTTRTDPRDPLSPWVTWPSLHRGVSSAEHHVRSLGQDVSTFRGRAIWEEYRARGESIGICGSMQSWPPIDPGPRGFYVPDTFARDERCVPKRLDGLQRLNLSLVRTSGRVRTRRLPMREAIAALPSAIGGEVSPRFFVRAARQLLAERRDPERVARRPTFQTLLFWDVFGGLFDPKAPPAFATFFTNHVAGVLHRHWDAMFPEDFADRAGATSGARAIAFALEVLDEIVGDALRYQRECPELVVVMASSMGQGAVHRDAHDGRELLVCDVARLFGALGVPSSAWSPLLAMVPQVAAELPEARWRDAIARELGACRTSSGAAPFRVAVRGTTVTLTLATPSSEDLDAGTLTLASGARARWEELGLSPTAVEAGTGSHVPEGSLAIVGRGIAPDPSRAPMPLTSVKAMLMELGGLRGDPS